MEWQPIETAPMDRTVVLLHKDGEVVAGWYDKHGPYGWCFLDKPELQHDPDIDYVIPNAWRREGHEPTDWMPLPDPPSNVG